MMATNESSKRALKDVSDNEVGAVVALKKLKKATSKKNVTLKELNEKLKHASKSELVSLLEHIFATYGEDATSILNTYTPDSPVPEDPLLHQCFHCQEKEVALYRLYDACVCHDCVNGVFKAITRQKMISIFEFTKAEADKLKRSSPPGAYSGYRYEWDTIVKALKKRDGSFFRFAEKKIGRNGTPTTGEFIQQATAADQSIVIHHALVNSKESSLKKLLKQVAKNVPAIKGTGEAIDTFAPAAMPA